MRNVHAHADIKLTCYSELEQYTTTKSVLFCYYILDDTHVQLTYILFEIVLDIFHAKHESCLSTSIKNCGTIFKS